jgi:hypothetical protein
MSTFFALMDIVNVLEDLWILISVSLLSLTLSNRFLSFFMILGLIEKHVSSETASKVKDELRKLDLPASNKISSKYGNSQFLAARKVLIDVRNCMTHALLWRIMFTTLFTQQLKRVKDKILEIS